MFTKIIRKISKEIFLLKIKNLKGLKIDSDLILNGKPMIDIKNNANIIIGKNVTLNSNNRGYHKII